MAIKLLVLGGTGMLGLIVLEKAANAENVQVTAFVRTPSKIPQNVREKIKVVVGDIMSKDDVSNALTDQDVVISCIGKRKDLGTTRVYSQGIRNIVEGMRNQNVKYLQLMGISFFLPNEFRPPRIFMPVIPDAENMIEYIKTVEDITWVATMAPNISNQEYTGTCKVEIDKLPGPWNVTKHDLADWLVTSVMDQSKMDEYKHKLVGISSMSTRYCMIS
ncbi:unnamed protein product [Clavelina lepadiformis]|uniref:NAD(P)-binding domain-containing protein n=1 Tax=Clavelina lepadiformis TaxID=159417 RepID=A0ABP0G8P6_CLALP